MAEKNGKRLPKQVLAKNKMQMGEMMRRLLILSAIVGLGFGSWWVWNMTSLKDVIVQYAQNGEILTLEARYTPEQIMDLNRKELLVDNQRTFGEPSLKFYPYLLITSKYTQADKKTREGVVLWGLVDGEMVLDTESWEKTHGFEDAINASATSDDFKILNALAKGNGLLSRDQLQKELRLDSDTLDSWIEGARKKHLVIQKGNDVLLHFQNPKILVNPETKIKQWLVSKPYSYEQLVARKYSRRQVETIAHAAFGHDFTIRSTSEVFLPIYSIEILNPDGSILTSYWNALNGRRITSQYLARIP